ncbi:MAG: hypothetical protein ACTSRK_19470 [Promethearchaeota archaeon]
MDTEERKRTLDGIFQEIRSYYDQMDEVREKILPLQRQTVRICSEIIKNVHRTEFAEIPTKIESAKQNLIQLQNLIDQAPGRMPKDYLQIVKQELGEAVIFSDLVVNGKIPQPAECGIDIDDYAYACADVVGEVRRYILKCLRNDQYTLATNLLEDMTELYNNLFTMDYPNGLIPGLRKKTDVARGILTRTEADVTLSKQMQTLQSALNNKS